MAQFEAGDKDTVVAATLRVSERSVERWRRDSGVRARRMVSPRRGRPVGRDSAAPRSPGRSGSWSVDRSHTAGLTSGGPWRASRS
ncbi:hypothetical protein ACFV8Z_26960 [Streptomyces sp. NPDC059837]|uniref:hypothetical protein n=1 Tax=Streptomyces sp. NPDC059837 TaxID=3346968 RepID=UPI0036625A7F